MLDQALDGLAGHVGSTAAALALLSLLAFALEGVLEILADLALKGGLGLCEVQFGDDGLFAGVDLFLDEGHL